MLPAGIESRVPPPQTSGRMLPEFCSAAMGCASASAKITASAITSPTGDSIERVVLLVMSSGTVLDPTTVCDVGQLSLNFVIEQLATGSARTSRIFVREFI